mmetsp:Transcript_3624/g.8651  ORF Transcript_3624/g.8651 Transcript_3624/m.8651 type:complete len:218 (+) Transcript_3624:878-1531(+)
MEVVARFFQLPIQQAAEELKVGETWLKQKCREHGIKRWPYRKVKSLERSIEKVQSSIASCTDLSQIAEMQSNLAKLRHSYDAIMLKAEMPRRPRPQPPPQPPAWSLGGHARQPVRQPQPPAPAPPEPFWIRDEGPTPKLSVRVKPESPHQHLLSPIRAAGARASADISDESLLYTPRAERAQHPEATPPLLSPLPLLPKLMECTTPDLFAHEDPLTL